MKKQIIILIWFLMASCYFIKSGNAETLQKGTSGINKVVSKDIKGKENIEQWYNHHEWLNGLNLTPNKSIDKKEFYKQYHASKAFWDMAFSYLKEADLASLKPGRYPLDGDNVYVIVTEAPTKVINEVSWEDHNNYADIHYIISGQEKIGVAPFSTATIKVVYDPVKDIGFYDEPKGKYYIANQGNFFIFFPQKDVHRPSIKVKGYDIVKKIVVKIKTSN